MNKIRVYELAKELDVPSKEVLDTLVKLGVRAQNHMSVLEGADAEKARATLRARTRGATAAKAPPPQVLPAPPKAGEKAPGVKVVTVGGGGIRPAMPSPKPTGVSLGRGIGRPLPKSESLQIAKTLPGTPLAEEKSVAGTPVSVVTPAASAPEPGPAETRATALPSAPTQVEAPARAPTQAPAEVPVQAPVSAPVQTQIPASGQVARPASPTPPRGRPVITAPGATSAPPRPGQSTARPVSTKPPVGGPATPPRRVAASTVQPGVARMPAVAHPSQPGQVKPQQGPDGQATREKPPTRVTPAAAPSQPSRPPQAPVRGPERAVQPSGPQPFGRPQEGRGQAAPGGRQAFQGGRQAYHQGGHQAGRGPAARGPAARISGRPTVGQPAPKTGGEKKPVARSSKPIRLEGPLTVAELAAKLALKGSDVIRALMGMGMMVSLNKELDQDTARIVATELGYNIEEVKAEVEVETAALEEEKEDDPALLKPRPPVVTVMGHVDHGKTSLLDAIRKTNVTATEAGGITQHIGAYTVEHGDRRITFIDTPGHEAFTSMRARGAQVTDVAILVVAADDGVMPQTIEAINHARAAEVPIIVAINKIDKPEAQPERVKRQLADQGLLPEDWGGKTVMVPVSARTKQGLDTLLEMVLLVADMEDLKANPERFARGTIIESKLDKGRGPVATLLVQSGTLRVGDVFTCGTTWGKVRAMVDDKGKRLKKAGPSQPVEVLGFVDVPSAGDTFVVVGDERKVKEIAAKRQEKKRREEQDAARRLTLDDVYRQIKEGQMKELNLIVKADVQGSVEALEKALSGIQHGEVKVKVIHGGVGAVSESDVMLASASGAIIIGFNVRPDPNARKVAEREKVDIRTYRIIYEAVDDIKAAIVGLLAPEYKEVVIGRAEVRQLFRVPKVGVVAGCFVSDGKITRTAGIRLIREGRVTWEGKIDSLKRFKDDVREVAEGYECGIGLENFNDIKEGDILEAFVNEEVKREVEL